MPKIDSSLDNDSYLPDTTMNSQLAEDLTSDTNECVSLGSYNVGLNTIRMESLTQECVLPSTNIKTT